jgi:uncharacterized protein YjbJ (UPF0337 family)
MANRTERVGDRFGNYIMWRNTMDKDRIEGSARELKGKVKETIGKATGDAKMRGEGAAEKAAGKVQNAIGGAKDALRDAARR